MKTMIVNLSVICVLMCSATAFAANTHSNFSAELARVQTLDRLGDSNRALHLSDQLVLKYPKNSEAWFEAAKVQWNFGLRSKAQADFIEARRLDPYMAYASKADVATLNKSIEFAGPGAKLMGLFAAVFAMAMIILTMILIGRPDASDRAKNAFGQPIR